jgi:hypothetical protein
MMTNDVNKVKDGNHLKLDFRNLPKDGTDALPSDDKKVLGSMNVSFTVNLNAPSNNMTFQSGQQFGD